MTIGNERSEFEKELLRMVDAANNSAKESPKEPEAKRTPKESLEVEYEHFRIGKKAASIHVRQQSYLANLIRIVKMCDEVNDAVKADGRNLPTITVHSSGMFNLHFTLFSKANDTLYDLECGIVSTKPYLEGVECPAIAPIDYDILIDPRNNDRRFDVDEIERRSQINDLPLANQIILTYDNACMLREDLEILFADVQFFMDMTNFRDELFDIDEFIDGSLMEIKIETKVNIAIKGMHSAISDLIDEITHLYCALRELEEE